jgi:hypothetical protein
MNQLLCGGGLWFWTRQALLSTTAIGAGTLKRSLVLLFGVLSYGVFFFTFVYQIGFVEGIVVPKAMKDRKSVV